MEEQKFNLMKIARKAEKISGRRPSLAYSRCDADECIPGNPL